MLYENLKEAGVKEEQLIQDLKKQNIKRTEDVFYAEWKHDKPLFVLPYEEKK